MEDLPAPTVYELVWGKESGVTQMGQDAADALIAANRLDLLPQRKLAQAQHSIARQSLEFPVAVAQDRH